MKTLIAILLAAATNLGAQNYAVLLYGTNAAGIPPHWPRLVQPIGTNTTPGGTWLLMTQMQLDNVKATNRAAYATWESNATYQAAQRLTNALDRLMVLHKSIPQGRALMSNAAPVVATIEASLASGTNSQSQVVARIRQLNGVVADQRVVLANILEYLQRLGPVLRDSYQPNADETQ